MDCNSLSTHLFLAEASEVRRTSRKSKGMAGFDISFEAFELLFRIALWIFIAASELDIFGARSRKTIHQSLEWLQPGITHLFWNQSKRKPPDKFE